MNPQLPQETPAESAPAAEASTEPEDAKSEVGITDGMNDHFELVLWTPKLKP